jgi:uncharacterized protein YbgA (DUF1722 family)/uncharacterized protein YbbK (DUF523 family)
MAAQEADVARGGEPIAKAPASSSPASGRAAWATDAPVRIGISSCLLGRPVRWDGGHRRDAFLVGQLGPFVEWVPVCPELEVGMGVPREPIRLVERAGDTRLVAERSGTDWSERMRAWARRRARELEALDLCGYVLKKDSPSCGLARVRVWNERGGAERRGRGVFAEALLESAPDLPVEEEGRLCDARLRENWIERVFAYGRLRSLFASRWTRGSLVAFHTAHKLQLLAHAPAASRALGRLVAEPDALERRALRERYTRGFMAALRQMATPSRHANALQHAAGHLRSSLDARDRRELAELVEDYRRGLVPLVVPITLIRHHVARLGVASLAGQVYLEPHPRELMLRNHV